VIFDGIVLAGGRSARLGGAPKARLMLDGRSLLQRSVDALAGARTVIVVGGSAPAGVVAVRETPEFGGPAAGIAAGLAVSDAERVLVVACDMPLVESVVGALLAAEGADGALLVDDAGRDQYLAGIYRADALRASVARFAAQLHGLPVRRLLEDLNLTRVPAAGITRDIDTWEDAAEFGIAHEGEA